MESLRLNPTSSNQELTLLQFWPSQKQNLKPANPELPKSSNSQVICLIDTHYPLKESNLYKTSHFSPSITSSFLLHSAYRRQSFYTAPHSSKCLSICQIRMPDSNQFLLKSTQKCLKHLSLSLEEETEKTSKLPRSSANSQLRLLKLSPFSLSLEVSASQNLVQKFLHYELSDSI